MNKLIVAMLCFFGMFLGLTGMLGCVQNDYEYARLACKKQRDVDFRDFDRFSKLFLSNECTRPGSLSVFSYLADLSYGAHYLPGPVCDRNGTNLLVNQGMESAVCNIEAEERHVIEKRRKVLDGCFNKFIKENPLQCYYWANSHTDALSSNMISSIFANTSTNCPYYREYSLILLNLYGANETNLEFGDMGSSTCNEIPFDAMYSMWKTNSEYVIQYNADGVQISVVDEEPYFRYTKMAPPIILVISNRLSECRK